MLTGKMIYTLVFLFLLSTAGFSQKQARNAQNTNTEVMTLVESERSFAKSATEIGVRDAFLKYFAADGVNFQPQPVVISEGAKNPPPALAAGKPKTLLLWEPIYSDIATSNDLGFTTGPYDVKENAPEGKILRSGFYFSVWQKQVDNSWKVLLDMGIVAPTMSPADRKLTTASQFKSGKKISAAEDAGNELAQIEQRFSTLSEKQATKAYKEFARDDVRLHRFQILPVLGKSEAIKHISEKEAKSSWKTIKTGVSASGDFAWSYGTYKITEGNSGEDKTKEGYYVRVWRRDTGNKWKMTVEVTNPLKV